MLAVKSSDVVESLDKQGLQVVGLKDEAAPLKIDGKELRTSFRKPGTVARDQPGHAPDADGSTGESESTTSHAGTTISPCRPLAA